jgi:MoxR-like ATPase
VDQNTAERVLDAILGSDRVTADDAVAVVTALAPVLTDGESGGPVHARIQDVLKRVDDADPRVAAILDWWFLVATGDRSPTGRCYNLPADLDSNLAAAMEALRDANPSAPVARWVRAKRELPGLLAAIPEKLDIESYGSVKLPAERQAWEHFRGWVDATREALLDERRAEPTEIDKDKLEKAMRALGIDENSPRWRHVVARVDEATIHLNRCVEAQTAAEPWRRIAEVPTLHELPADLVDRLGVACDVLLGSVLEAVPPEVGPEETAARLEDLAAAVAESRRLAFLPLVREWMEKHNAWAPSLYAVAMRLDALQKRMEILREQGDDVDEVEYHLLDGNLREAESALEKAEVHHGERERRAKLLRQMASLEERLQKIQSDVPEGLRDSFAEARRLVGGNDHGRAAGLLRELQERVSDLELTGNRSIFDKLLSELRELQAPQNTVYDFEQQSKTFQEGSIDAATARDAVSALQAAVGSIRGSRRAEATERIARVEDLLGEAATEFNAAARGEIELLVTRVEELLAEGRVAEAYFASLEAERECDRHRVHLWTYEQGEERLIQHVLGYCNQDVDFQERDVKRFYVALKTKPFVIIAGLTGSGKSTLARLVAEAMGATASNGQFQRVAVRPDWIDQSEVLGFVNPTSNRFEPGWLADLMRRCEREPDRMFFALLDEMNLAPVEQYLAEALSAMEEVRSGGREVTVPLYSRGSAPANRDEWPVELRYPTNLFLIGTVNIDETTRPLSDRVLDRANVLQLTINASEHHHRSRSTRGRVKPWSVPRAEWSKTCSLEPNADAHDFVVHVTEALRRVGIGVGMRTHVELERFLTNAVDILDPVDALDYGVLQRVIPKIRGFKRDLAEGLEELAEVFQESGCQRCLDVIRWWRDPRLSDDEYLDGTDPRLALRHA